MSEHPLTEAEQAAAVALAAHHNAHSTMGGLAVAAFAGEARAVVAAVRPPIADEVALQLGRDCLRDGVGPFLTRLVGREQASRLIGAIAAETLNGMADRFEHYGTLAGQEAWPFVA